MKKYISLFLLALMTLSFLVSCSDPHNNNTSFYDDSITQDSTNQNGTTVDSSTTGNSQAPVAPLEDSSTTDNTQTPEAPPEDSSTTDNTQTPDAPSTEKVNAVTWQFDYAYWDSSETLTGESNTKLLVDGGILGGDFDGIVIPKDITAGDTITINYTGSYTVLETYPSHISLNGEVISYSFSYTNVIPVFTENLTEEMLLEYDAPNNYVILDRGGRFTTLDKYEGETVYLVEDQRELRQRTEDTPFYVACILAYNPRDLEDGVPDYENISESEAREIAHSHYYNTYFLTCTEDFEYEMSQPENLEGCWKIRITEYRDNGYTYCYTIDKITGEIVSMGAIDNE